MFPVFHGPFGEDGSLQGLFELADLPYVGSGIEGSAIGLNKWVHRSLFREAGIPVVRTLAFVRDAWDSDPSSWLEPIAEIGFPSFVKPAHLGSSVGISRVASSEDIARRDGARVPTRRPRPGRSVRWIARARGRRDRRPVRAAADGHGRRVRSSRPETFYDYDSKYLTDDTELQIPAEVSAELYDASASSRSEPSASRARKVSRASISSTSPPTDSLFVNEINTIPGMTSASMFPKVWAASGVPFPEVVGRLLDLAIERHERKSKLEPRGTPRTMARSGASGARLEVNDRTRQCPRDACDALDRRDHELPELVDRFG